MYTVKQASLRSGVSVPVIRAWERRYGLLRPRRTPAGYRMYDDAAIDTLIRVRDLVRSGWAPSEASRAVLAGEVTPTPSAPVPSEAGGRESRRRDSLLPRFVDAAIAVDVPSLSSTLDEMLASGSYETIVDGLVMPAASALGEAWDDGRLDVAGEHAATAVIERRLSLLYDAAGTSRAPQVVVGLPPGSRHALGAFAFAVAIRRQGVEVLYLGADVPLDSWVSAVRIDTIRVAVIGIVTADDRTSGLDVTSALLGLDDPPTLAIGGRHASWIIERVPSVVLLPEQIHGAAAIAARLARGLAVEPDRDRRSGQGGRE
jgi:MerR family transcriptional regulator, light-induced transcriptional regulator